MLYLILLSSLLLLQLNVCESTQVCTSPISQSPEITLPKRPIPDDRKIQSVKLRIIRHYTDEFNNLNHSQEMKSALIDTAADYWSEALHAVDAIRGRFLVSKQCTSDGYRIIGDKIRPRGGYCVSDCVQESTCGGVQIPSEYLQCQKLVAGKPKIVKDENANKLAGDFLLLVHHRVTEHCRDDALAYAETCVINAEYNRPIVGYINFCKDFGDFQYPSNTIAYQTVRHQLGHALGLNAAMFAFMRDEKGDPRTERDERGIPRSAKNSQMYYDAGRETIGDGYMRWESEVSSFGRHIKQIQTPYVLEAARKHFGCDDLKGVELEGAGVRNNHFKKRVVMNELMSAVISFDSKVSNITLGYFADSGWYQVNFDKVEDWTWGQRLGCGFVQYSCYEYITRQNAIHVTHRPWCTDLKPLDTECVQDNSAYGRCNLMEHSSPMEKRFQYFLNSNYGGTDAYTDFCPYIQSFENDTGVPTTICSHEENNLFLTAANAGEHFGADSVCVNHDSSQPWEYINNNVNREYIPRMASCHKYECSSTEGLIIIFGEEKVRCHLGPSIVAFDVGIDDGRLLGRFNCPGCYSVCKDQCPE